MYRPLYNKIKVPHSIISANHEAYCISTSRAASITKPIGLPVHPKNVTTDFVSIDESKFSNSDKCIYSLGLCTGFVWGFVFMSIILGK
jgi:hypothetical protein